MKPNRIIPPHIADHEEVAKRSFVLSSQLIQHNIAKRRSIDEILDLQKELELQETSGVNINPGSDIETDSIPLDCELLRLVSYKSFGTSCDKVVTNRVIDALGKILYDSVTTEKKDISSHSLIINTSIRDIYKILYPDSVIGGKGLDSIKEAIKELDGTFYPSSKEGTKTKFKKFVIVSEIETDSATGEIGLTIQLGEIFRFNRKYSAFSVHYFDATRSTPDVTRRLYQYLAQRISITSTGSECKQITLTETKLLEHCNINNLNITKFRKQLKEAFTICVMDGLLEAAWWPKERKTEDRKYKFILNLSYAGNRDFNKLS